MYTGCSTEKFGCIFLQYFKSEEFEIQGYVAIPTRWRTRAYIFCDRYEKKKAVLAYREEKSKLPWKVFGQHLFEISPGITCINSEWLE